MTELLARLAPKTQDWRGLPPGGLPELPPELIAGALAGLPRGPELLARLSYAGDDTVRRELVDLLVWRASRFVRRDDLPPHPEDPRLRRPGFIGELCVAALQDIARPPQCPRCNGTKFAPTPSGSVRVCPVCDGLGRVSMGVNRARRLFRISATRWKRVRPHYQRIEALVARWDSTAVGHIKRRLRDLPPPG